MKYWLTILFAFLVPLPVNSSTTFLQLLNMCRTGTAGFPEEYIAGDSLSSSIRSGIGLRYDRGLRDYFSDAVHNIWDEIVSTDGGVTVTLADLKKVFYDHRYRKVKRLLAGDAEAAQEDLFFCDGHLFHYAGGNSDGILEDILNGITLKAAGGFRFIKENEELFLIVVNFNKLGLPEETLYTTGNYREKYRARVFKSIYYNKPDNRYYANITGRQGLNMFVDLQTGAVVSEKYTTELSGKHDKMIFRNSGGRYLVNGRETGLDIDRFLPLDREDDIILAERRNAKALFSVERNTVISDWFPDIDVAEKYPYLDRNCYLVRNKNGQSSFLGPDGRLAGPWYDFRFVSSRAIRYKQARGCLVEKDSLTPGLGTRAFFSLEKGELLSPWFDFQFTGLNNMTNNDDFTTVVQRVNEEYALFSLKDGRRSSEWYTELRPAPILFAGHGCLLAGKQDKKWTLISHGTGKRITGYYKSIEITNYTFRSRPVVLVENEAGHKAFLSTENGRVAGNWFRELVNKTRFENTTTPPDYFLLQTLGDNFTAVSRKTGLPLCGKIKEITPLMEPFLGRDCYMIKDSGGGLTFVPVNTWERLSDIYLDIVFPGLLFSGERCLLVKSGDGGWSFLSLESGLVKSDSYLSVNRSPVIVNGKKYLRVRNGKNQWGFISTEGEAPSGWFSDIAPRRSLFRDNVCFIVTSTGGKKALLSPDKGKLLSGWFDDISAGSYQYRMHNCLLVQDSNKGTAFLDSGTGHVIGNWFAGIDRNVYRLGRRSYYKIYTETGNYHYISAVNGIAAEEDIIKQLERNTRDIKEK